MALHFVMVDVFAFARVYIRMIMDVEMRVFGNAPKRASKAQALMTEVPPVFMAVILLQMERIACVCLATSFDLIMALPWFVKTSLLHALAGQV